MINKTRTLIYALITILAVTVVVPSVSGQDQFGSGNSIVGTWVAAVTIRNCQTNAEIVTVRALNTFNQGGTMMEAGNGLYRGPGHGTWDRSKGNEYTSTFMFFRFNPDGTFAGSQKVNRVHTLSDHGSALTTTATFEVTSPDGTVLVSGCATESAVRLAE